jgi:ribosomal-protein-alanine N-acetyltransferase
LHDLEVEITEIREEFLKGIYEIEQQSFSAPYPPQVFTVMAREVPETFLVAISGQAVVGYVLASLRRGDGHVLSIAVRRGFRRRGIGTKLMERILIALLRKGVTRVNLEVRTSNRTARRFYAKLGFEETGLIRKYYNDGEDAVKMSKNLTEQVT